MTREEAIERLKQNKAAAEFYAGMVQNTHAIENELKDIEALDMAIEALSDRSYGEWVDEDGNKVPLHKDGYPLGSCWCNQCHEWLVGSDEYAIKGNFCPNCGADMRKENK